MLKVIGGGDSGVDRYFANLSHILNDERRNWLPVILRNPATLLAGSPSTDLLTFFSSVMSLKIGGYQRKISDNTLAVDQYDFVADHVCLCEKKDGILIPHLSFKAVPLDRCEYFHLPFPFQGMLQHSDFPQLAQLFEFELDSQKKRARKIVYNGSLTVSAELAKDATFSPHIKSLISILFASYHQTAESDLIYSLATIPSRMDELMLRHGFKTLPLAESLTREGRLHFSGFNNVEAIPMSLEFRHTSEQAKSSISNHKTFWKKLFVFDLAEGEEKRKAA